LQIVNPFGAPQSTLIQLRKGLGGTNGSASVMTLTNANPEAENTVDSPDAIMPQTRDFNGVAPEFSFSLPPVC
jgi:hypothetical protein